jgi:hypothetical protein
VDGYKITRERIQASIKVSVSGCWEWQLYIRRNGYGQMKFEGKTVDAHRVSYRAHKGEIPDGMYVCHTCDVKRCCNPEHLFLGTQGENMHDYVSKGGRLGPKRFLTNEQRMTAKQLREAGIAYSEIGRELGVATMTIWNALNKPVANDNEPINTERHLA